MNRFVAILIAVASCLIIYAQDPADAADRQRWLSEIRSYKHDFLAKELQLSEQQQQAFFALYDIMEDEIEDLILRTRNLENSILANHDASDQERLNAAKLLFEFKQAEGDIELRYFHQFMDILTPLQLLQLKRAERKFNILLVRHHRRMLRR